MNNKLWFYADSKYGQLFIGLNNENRTSEDSSNRLPHVLQSAIAMREAEEVLQEIENWLNCGLKLRPSTIIPSPITTLLIKKNESLSKTGVEEIVLGIYKDSLPNLPVPENLQTDVIEFSTSDLPVNLVLAEIDISREEYDKIDKGSVLVLPETYESEWHIKLYVPTNKEICCTGMLRKDCRSIALNKGAGNQFNNNTWDNSEYTSDANDTISITVAIQDKISIAFDQLLCWRHDNECQVGQSIRQYPVDILCNEEVLANGHLISIANGYGVYVESEFIR
jgi:hypothetical protein